MFRECNTENIGFGGWLPLKSFLDERFTDARIKSITMSWISLIEVRLGF
jgi:hypothetical protein